jgi:hypothetical protein
MLNAIQGKVLTGDPHDMIVNMAASPRLVFLKQFRDVSCPTKACYQAVIEAPIDVQPSLLDAYAPLDPKMFNLTVSSPASSPIATELGLPAGQPLTPISAFHANFDFQIGLGTEVWRAPT